MVGDTGANNAAPSHQPAAAEEQQAAGVIPTQMAPIGEPNVAYEQGIIQDMHNKLEIDKIYSNKNYPCAMDENSIGNASPIYCHCDAYNSEFHKNTQQAQKQKLIQCKTCKRYCHLDC